MDEILVKKYQYSMDQRPLSSVRFIEGTYEVRTILDTQWLVVKEGTTLSTALDIHSLSVISSPKEIANPLFTKIGMEEEQYVYKVSMVEDYHLPLFEEVMQKVYE